MKHRQADFYSALEAGDVRLVRRMSSSFMPHLPQPKSAADAEIAMHMARTVCEFISPKARLYSHSWLKERNLPSQLPDRMKPSAERVFPIVVEAVGISVNCKNPILRPAMIEVRRAMEEVVAEHYADGNTDPAIVQPRMMAARDKTMRSLFGR